MACLNLPRPQSKLFSKLSFPRRRKSATKQLFKEAEVQQQELKTDESFKLQMEKMKHAQKKILENNPEFAAQMLQLKESVEKGKVDAATLQTLLSKHRKMIEENPQLRNLVKAQEEIIDNSPEMQAKLEKMKNLHKEALSTA
mmetsp:Transcript_1557/g.1777  ORF Transcript_1557/g.1777 Transcript_1557/m.1777 type:complete len:142 (+) Transcript_1557:209-634(+)